MQLTDSEGNDKIKFLDTKIIFYLKSIIYKKFDRRVSRTTQILTVWQQFKVDHNLLIYKCILKMLSSRWQYKILYNHILNKKLIGNS